MRPFQPQVPSLQLYTCRPRNPTVALNVTKRGIRMRKSTWFTRSPYN